MLVEVPVPGSFRGRSHAAPLAAGKSGESDAVVECISGCKNPFTAERSPAGARAGGARGAIQAGARLRTAAKQEQLYDLEADPGELRPLPPGAEKAVRRRLLDRARQHISDSVQSRDAGYRLSARLRDLRITAAIGQHH